MKLKKLLSIFMISAMLLTMTACGNKTEDNTVGRETNVVDDSSDVEETNDDEEIDDSSDAEEAYDEGSAGDSSEEEPGEEAEEETSEPVAPSNGSVDLSNVATETEALAPAALGQWIQSTTYSATSGLYETMYWRIVEVTTDCQEDIDRYNEEDHLYVFEPLEQEELAYHMAIYEVYFPEDFPAAEWGISSPYISISANNPNGGGIEYRGFAYIGLGSSYNIAEEQDIFPGDVYTGKALFAMIDDDVEYVFEYYHNTNDEEDGLIHDYAASK